MIAVLLLMAAVLLLVAWNTGRRAFDREDYFLAGRRMPGNATALSYAVNALPLWMLVGIFYAAYAWGFAAIWILVSALLANVIGWFFVAPRLRTWTAVQGGFGLMQFLMAETGVQLRAPIVLSATLILFVGILIGMAAYLPLAGSAVAAATAVSPRTAIVFGVFLATLCALVGGYRGVCRNDAIRSLAILCLFLGVAVLATVAAGGWPAIWSDLEAGAATMLWSGETVAILAVTFVLGTLVLSLVPLGHPETMHRFIACAAGGHLAAGGRVALLWTLLTLGSVLVCGWSARLLLPALPAGGAMVTDMLAQLLHPSLALAATAMLLVTTFSSLDSILLVMAGTVSAEVTASDSLDWPKPAVVLAGGLVLTAALQVPEPSFERMLLAWTLPGAAFGPLLLVRLSGKRVRPGSMLGSIWAGFILTLLLHLLPSAPGDFLERALPFVVALGIALTGGERRRDPDRADRAQLPAADVT